MARKGFILLMFLALVNTFSSVTLAQQPAPIIDVLPLNRSSFPRNFVFGTASASYQYEGAANEGGRKPSMWDEYTHKHPERITDGSNGDVAVDQYHRYKEDIHIMKDMNLDAYRFSISWSRILPNGKRSGGINKEGIEYYNHLIDNLLDNGLQPFVTLFHWDIPQTLEEEYGGFLSPLVVADFRDFVEVCFEKFGNRVKHWITLNEPWGYSSKGYANGDFAPGRCSESTCLGGDSGTEPYIVSHYLLLAHAAAVDLYRKKFQDIQKGVIGITLVSHYFEPYSNSQADKDASKRALDFMLGWYMDPLTSGKYPESMRSLVGARLPKFFEEQSKLLAGSFDFIGINYYTTYYAANANTNASKINPPSYTTDANVDQLTSRNGVPIGPRYGADWLYIYPKGIRKLLFYIKYTYNNPSIYITENGMAEYDDPTLSIKEMLQDTYRIDYYYRHLYYLLLAIRDDVRVKGYFAWSLLDNFEWKDGYTVRFGLNYVDFNSNFERHAKLSAKWFKAILKKL